MNNNYDGQRRILSINRSAGVKREEQNKEESGRNILLPKFDLKQINEKNRNTKDRIKSIFKK